MASTAVSITDSDFQKLVSDFANVEKSVVDTCIKSTAKTLKKTESEVIAKMREGVNAVMTSCSKLSKDKNLFDYQQKVVKYMFTHHGLITAFATGTGKTFTAVACAACMHSVGSYLGKKVNILVVTPAALVDNMKKEFKKFPYNFGADVTFVSSNKFRDVFFARAIKNAGTQESTVDDSEDDTVGKANITDPKTLRFVELNAKRDDISCNKHTFLIVDEAHEFKTDYLRVFDDDFDIKNPEGSRSQMFVEHCYPKVWRILLMTATPMLNRWFDIMNLIAAVKNVNPTTQESKIVMIPKPIFLDPQPVGTEIELVTNTFAVGSDFTLKVPKDYISALTLQDVTVNLPFINYDTPYFRNTIMFKKVAGCPEFPTTNQKYQSVMMTNEYFAIVKKIEKAAATVKTTKEGKEKSVTIGELQALQSKAASMPGNPKIAVMKKLLDSKEYDKFIVYSRFLAPIRGLKKVLDDYTTEYVSFIITGTDVPPHKRDAVLQEINSTPKAVVYISDAGGQGLDFKGIECVVLYEPGVNSSREEQVIGRAVRCRSHVHLPEDRQRVDVIHLYSMFPTWYLQKQPKQKPFGKKSSGARVKMTIDQRIGVSSLKKNIQSMNFRNQLELLQLK